MRLQGKICAITGAGRGIGRAAVKLFAQQGATVALLEVDEKLANQAAQEARQAGGRVSIHITDISDPRQVEKAMQEIRREHGRLDVLYNNASVFWADRDGAVDQLDPENLRKILSINLDGLMHCTRLAIPLLRLSGRASIINTASSAAILGIPGCDAYTASKGATVALTRAWATRYGPQKIRVNCIAPAGIDTAMVKQSNLDNPNFDAQVFFELAPLGRFGTPEEVANVALFLASDESSYVNGAVIVADGGITISSISETTVRKDRTNIAK